MGWRGLAWFWAAVLLVLAVGAAILQTLGPPAHAVANAPAPASSPPKIEAAGPPVIAGPEPALLEPSKLYPPSMLPRVAADGRAARVVYARRFDTSDTRPRIGLVVAGFGTSDAESKAGIEALPAAVDLAVSPYAANPEPLLQSARAHGHEVLLSIPMEPAGYPLVDAGSQSLMAAADPAANRNALEWTLSRFQGYVGTTGALGGAMRGERFADQPGAIGPVLEELGRRGLLYVDPRPGHAPVPGSTVPTRAVDVVVDDPPARAQIEAKLADLERIARDRGVALGLAGPPASVTIERIAAWAQGLEARGIVLAPVSALVGPGGK